MLFSIFFTIALICVSSVAPSPITAKTYQWDDYLVPFKREIRLDRSDSSIEVRFPDDVLKNDTRSTASRPPDSPCGTSKRHCGHGVFTYYLLRGLKGEADYSKDSRVTLGEIVPYLSEQVRRATRNAQSPTVAGRFDPALTIGK